MHQDDPKKCTASKLVRFNLAKLITSPKLLPNSSIILNPYAKDVLTPMDKSLIEHGGLTAVDCSWKKAAEVFKIRFRGVKRRLPSLLAANPVNYCKLGMLSSAEALAAALYITGYEKLATKVLSIFKWGETFLALNEEPLRDYNRARSSDRVLELEEEYFGWVRPS